MSVPDAPASLPVPPDPDAAAAREEEDRFRGLLEAELESFLTERTRMLREVSAESVPLLEAIHALARGGKRLRALLCYWGFRGAGGAPLDPAAVRAGLALELFQSAALIHDDIIDRSDTRRGAPSVHRRFTGTHRDSGWHLDGDRFGTSAAILAGDLCLALSEEVFTSVGPAAAHGTAARDIFNRMRTEVMAGQYLDILEEVVGPGHRPEDAVRRARNILRYKAAKYTTEHPLAIGGALAGADSGLQQAYAAFSLPLGEAFQLRDDVLGVFGDPETTGKPAGDDLREGKRTVLIAYTLEHGDAGVRAEVSGSLGAADLDEDGVQRLRALITETGALAATEELIAGHTAAADRALAALDLPTLAGAALARLADAAVRRRA